MRIGFFVLNLCEEPIASEKALLDAGAQAILRAARQTLSGPPNLFTAIEDAKSDTLIIPELHHLALNPAGLSAALRLLQNNKTMLVTTNRAGQEIRYNLSDGKAILNILDTWYVLDRRLPSLKPGRPAQLNESNLYDAMKDLAAGTTLSKVARNVGQTTANLQRALRRIHGEQTAQPVPQPQNQLPLIAP
jgi:hypothetical protein